MQHSYILLHPPVSLHYLQAIDYATDRRGTWVSSISCNLQDIAMQWHCTVHSFRDWHWPNGEIDNWPKLMHERPVICAATASGGGWCMQTHSMGSCSEKVRYQFPFKIQRNYVKDQTMFTQRSPACRVSYIAYSLPCYLQLAQIPLGRSIST